MRGDRLRTPLLIGLLTAAAVAINVHAPTVFFDSQMMVGGSLGVFALLCFGWPGLVVGVAALAVTFVRWGHPFELIVGTGFLVWLQVFLDRFNGGPANRGNGRVLLAAIAYWLLVGFWLEVAFFRAAFGMGTLGAVGLGLKETVTSLCNATLGLLLFTAVTAAARWRRTGVIRPREVAIGLVLAAATVPAMALVFVLSAQLKQASLQSLLWEMRAFGTRAASLAVDDITTEAIPTARDAGSMEFAVHGPDGIVAASDPALFARLARDYVEEVPSRTGAVDLELYVPRRDAATITRNAESYVFTEVTVPPTSADGARRKVTVVEPLTALVNTLDYRLILPSFSVILGFLALGAIVTWLVGTASERRAEAEQSLQAATERMRLAAASAGIGFWSRDLAAETEEWDDQMLRIYGVSREEFDGRWEPFLHPEDRQRVEEEAQRAIDEGRYGEYVFRIIRPDGTVRHLKGMSQALRDAHGRPTLDLGVDIDMTRQVEADLALAAAREQERRHEEAHRHDLEKKLKTSLNAAAIAHEINQPLSRVILRTRMGLETATGTGRDLLAAVVADAERVVTVIEKMKVLLRNVETVHHEVDLAVVTASGLHQVKRQLRDAGVKVVRGGPEQGCLLLGDEVQLQMVVTNLLVNAVEAIAAGDVDRREIAIEQHARDGVVELVVGDSGPGWAGGTLDEALLNTTKPGGTGVGLYVVKTAVENHRGRITIGRSPLGGAEFRITFPRADGSPAAGAVDSGGSCAQTPTAPDRPS